MQPLPVCHTRISLGSRLLGRYDSQSIGTCIPILIESSHPYLTVKVSSATETKVHSWVGKRKKSIRETGEESILAPRFTDTLWPFFAGLAIDRRVAACPSLEKLAQVGCDTLAPFLYLFFRHFAEACVLLVFNHRFQPLRFNLCSVALQRRSAMQCNIFSKRKTLTQEVPYHMGSIRLTPLRYDSR